MPYIHHCSVIWNKHPVSHLYIPLLFFPNHWQPLICLFLYSFTFSTFHFSSSLHWNLFSEYSLSLSFCCSRRHRTLGFSLESRVTTMANCILCTRSLCHKCHSPPVKKGNCSAPLHSLAWWGEPHLPVLCFLVLLSLGEWFPSPHRQFWTHILESVPSPLWTASPRPLAGILYSPLGNFELERQTIKMGILLDLQGVTSGAGTTVHISGETGWNRREREHFLSLGCISSVCHQGLPKAWPPPLASLRCLKLLQYVPLCVFAQASSHWSLLLSLKESVKICDVVWSFPLPNAALGVFDVSDLFTSILKHYKGPNGSLCPRPGGVESSWGQ